MLALILAGCTHTGAQAVIEGRYAETPATVHQVADVWTLVPDADPSTRLCVEASALPEAARAEGAKVVFTGTRGEPAPNVRTVCSPLELGAIRVAD